MSGRDDEIESGDAKLEEFDRYAGRYEALHQQSISASGESTEYFAEYKRDCLQRIAARAPVLDYGCGIGNLTEKLIGQYADVHAYDPSPESLKIAQGRAPSATFHGRIESVPGGHFHTAVVAGVLHHVPPDERTSTLEAISCKLAPGGRIVVFEHNPWNPLTRKAVADCPFDEGAILLRPVEIVRHLRAAGFGEPKLDYIVFFPRILARLRPLEPRLGWCALGAQTMTVATRR